MNKNTHLQPVQIRKFHSCNGIDDIGCRWDAQLTNKTLCRRCEAILMDKHYYRTAMEMRVIVINEKRVNKRNELVEIMRGLSISQ